MLSIKCFFSKFSANITTLMSLGNSSSTLQQTCRPISKHSNINISSTLNALLFFSDVYAHSQKVLTVFTQFYFGRIHLILLQQALLTLIYRFVLGMKML